MRCFFNRAILLSFAFLSLCGLGLYAADGTPDDVKKSDSETKPAAKSALPSTPAPGLTEREQWMLERIEQLEKRVAELESKGSDATASVSASPTPAKPAPAPATNPAAPNPAAPAPATVAATPSPTSAGPGAVPSTATVVAPGSSSSAAVNPQDQPAQGNAAVSTTAKQPPVAPFSDADWTWLNGNARTKDIYWDTKFFTPEIRFDTNYVADFNHPTDHSIGGSSELFRSYEVQLEQLGVGGDFHWDDVRGRLMTQFGMYSVTTPRNDPSPGHGQWDLAGAYRYISEGYGGYHFNVLHGVNVDAGIFMSYIGLFSYYNFDNWAYQPSYVSSNTPWFFNGVRVQIFPSTHLKIEPWFINGWQSYASANHTPGIGGQIKWTPKPWLNIISNNYGVGEDDLFTPGRRRIHTDNSVEVKYYDNPERELDKMAFSLTGDLGCEYGAGVSCYGDHKGGPKQSFVGWMGYNRFWFHRDTFGLTIGGGQINNPGRYLVLLPPINGMTAVTASTNSPYFPESPGDPFKAWDSSITFDYMPKQYITFRWEYDYRHANVPYWSGRGGITPPGGNNGFPQYYVCSSGATSNQTTLAAAEAACGGGMNSVWFPDLRKDESFIDMAIMVKF
jgi:Putative beta-barrel porin-2, OmpL-like. bbp2